MDKIKIVTRNDRCFITIGDLKYIITALPFDKIHRMHINLYKNIDSDDYEPYTSWYSNVLDLEFFKIRVQIWDENNINWVIEN